MNKNLMRLATIVISAAITAGCASGPQLSSGLYSLDVKMTKPGVAKPYDDVYECVVTVQGTNVVVKLNRAAGTDLVGSTTATHLTLSAHQQNPDPMIVGMKLRIILEGVITRTDFATGRANGYADTNNYITGVWTLRKIGEIGASNQAFQPVGEPGALQPQR